MANKLYEEEDIRAIAENLRLHSNNKTKTFTVSEMAQGVQIASQDSFENGRDVGMGEGVAYVKTREAKDETHVTYSISPNEGIVTIAVESGYYAENIDKVISADDLEPITDGAYDHGYDRGYNEGLAAGGTTDHTLEDALISGSRIEEYYNDRIISVRPYAFAKCTELFAANLPNCISIGASSFYACSALSTVTLGPGAWENTGDGLIGTGAFASCVELHELILRYPWIIINLGSGAFANTPLQIGSGCIYVEDDLVDAYMASDEWSGYNIKSILERE